MYRLIRESYPIYIFAGLTSIILSLWICASASIINPDAMCYLQSAETMQKGIDIAMHLCEQAKWPFYSLLIAMLVKLTSISYINAAYVLNGFFSLLTVFAFICIVNLLANQIYNKKNNRIVWLAAGVVLLANEFNSLKSTIVRDHGFWAFYLLSIFFLLQFFCLRGTWRNAIGWGVSIIIATLFRIEGVVFLFCMPFLALFSVVTQQNSTQSTVLRIKLFLQLNAITVFAGIFLCAWLMMHPEKSVGRLGELYYQLTHGAGILVAKFRVSADHLAKHVLSVHATHEASTILFIMLIFWYLFSVMTNLSFIYTILVIYAWYKKILNVQKPMLNVLWCYIIINMVVMLVFLFEHMFLSHRYLVALSLTWMIWVPFALDSLMQKPLQRKWLVILVFVTIFVSSVGGIFDFGHSKRYLRDAGVWLAENTPQTVKIYSNDPMVLYYSQRFGNKIFEVSEAFRNINVIAEEKWKYYDYIAIRLKKKPLKSEVKILNELNQLNRKPSVVFDNHHGEQVQIYISNL